VLTPASIRQQALAGGRYLAVRHALGMALRFGAVVALTRLIGPSSYGLYAGALAIVTVLSTLSIFGTDVFLIRREEEPGRDVEAQSFSLLVVSSLAAAGLGILIAVALAGPVVDEAFGPPLLVLAATIPLNVLWVPAQARLERSFRYKEMAAIELGGDAVLYGVTIGLGIAGAGVWAPVAGYGAMQAWLLLASCFRARYRPRWYWSRSQLDEILRHGLGYSAADWVARLHELVYPVVVGRYGGPIAVGQVALALRLVDTLSFVKRAARRIAVVALAKLQGDRRRLGRAHSEGMALQLIGTGPPLAAFALVSPWLVPALFGDGWSTATAVFPLLALVTLVGTLFNLHSSALQVCGRNAPVVRLRLAQLLLSLVASVALVPRYGVIGYGLAEVVRLAAFVLVDRSVRTLFVPSYGPAIVWLVAWIPPLLGAWLGLPWSALAFAPAVVVVLSAPGRRQLAGALGPLRVKRTRRRAGDGSSEPGVRETATGPDGS
jgi:PST family polysaccharide transporter